jgi:hypothetical protein
MRKVMKLLHSLASCGLIGGLLASMVMLLANSSHMHTADPNVLVLLSNYLIFPSLAVVLVTGLLAMVVHPPFQELRWVWLKALLGITVFEAALGVVARAGDHLNSGPHISDIEVKASLYEISALLLLGLANIVLAIWRPRLGK